VAIKTIKGKETKRVFAGQFSKRIPREIQKQGLKCLRRLDQAARLSDLRFPSSMHLEALRHDRKGQHAIRINDQWRICFAWRDGDAYKVEIADYH